jgi:predicted ATPase
MGRFLHGWARTALDPDPERGLAEMEEGLAAWNACGAKVLRPQLLTLVARGHLAVGGPDEASALLDQAEAAVAETGEVYYDSGVAAARGEVHLDAFRRHGRPEDRERAGRCLEEAIEIARRQGARALEAEAAALLARVP